MLVLLQAEQVLSAEQEMQLVMLHRLHTPLVRVYPGWQAVQLLREAAQVAQLLTVQLEQAPLMRVNPVRQLVQETAVVQVAQLVTVQRVHDF
jgi:hypothetical protein